MASLPYIQLYVSDYLADTAHLSTTEHGAYLLLIFNYWQRGESFKAKDERSLNKRLACVARMTEHEWENVRETLAEFFDVSETEWIHNRIEDDLYQVNSKSEKARAAGKASAERRSNKRSTNAEQTLNHTDKDTDTDTELNTIDTNVSIVVNGETIPDCPHQEIISLYKKNIPMGIQPKAWDGARAVALKSRWRERKERQDLAWWDKFFDYVSQSKFLTGQVVAKDRKPFEITLPWLLKPENFNKIIEGYYHR